MLQLDHMTDYKPARTTVTWDSPVTVTPRKPQNFFNHLCFYFFHISVWGPKQISAKSIIFLFNHFFWSLSFSMQMAVRLVWGPCIQQLKEVTDLLYKPVFVIVTSMNWQVTWPGWVFNSVHGQLFLYDFPVHLPALPSWWHDGMRLPWGHPCHPGLVSTTSSLKITHLLAMPHCLSSTLYLTSIGRLSQFHGACLGPPHQESQCQRYVPSVLAMSYQILTKNFMGRLSWPVPLDKEMGQRRVRLGPAARLGPQPLGVRLELKITHGGIIGEILAKGK